VAGLLPISPYPERLIHSRVTMNMIANSETITVRLQKICILTPQGRGLAPSPLGERYGGAGEASNAAYASHLACQANDQAIRSLVDHG